MIDKLKNYLLRTIILFLISFITLSLTNCTPGKICSHKDFTSLTREQKKNANYYIDADVVYRNEKFKPGLLASNDVNELIYVRMTETGKYVKEGRSTTFAWMKNGKRIMLGDPRIGGSYDEVPSHTIEIAFSEDLHLVFESVSNEKYTLKSVLYQGVDVQNSNNPLGDKYSPVYYMMDVDLRFELASE